MKRATILQTKATDAKPGDAVAESGHSSGNYALFRREGCGPVVNADRKESLAVAVKTLLERRVGYPAHIDALQISDRRLPVMAPVRS